MSLENEGEDVGTRYYGTILDDPNNYGYDYTTGIDDPNNYGYDYTTGVNETPVDWSGYGGLTPEELGKLNTITDSNSLNAIANLAKSTLGGRAGSFLKKYLFDPTTGNVNLAGLGSAAMTLYGLANKDKQGGYNKPVPKMDMVREQVQYNDPNRRPGEGGRQYFTDPRFVAQGNAEGLAAAKAASAQQASGLQAAMKAASAPAPNPYAGKMKMAYNPQPVTGTGTTGAGLPQIPTTVGAKGGIDFTNSASTTPASGVISNPDSKYEENPPSGIIPDELIFNPPRGTGNPNAKMPDFEALAKTVGTPFKNPAPAGSVAPNIDYSEKTFPDSSVISNPAEKAMQERLNTPIRSQNPQDFGGPGMIENPEYITRYSGPDTPMDMRYVPRYISSNPQAAIDFSKFAAGGLADAGRYLQGETDGMADKIPSSIDGEQPAALSHGEFVIPADVVSHLGNGNSDAGAQKLYEMMDRIRQARTGTTEQGKEINPDEFTMGGLAAAYAGGGAVKGFSIGGPSVLENPTPTASGAGGIPNDVSRTSTLSPWVGDYVTNALGQGAALAAAPYQAYQGPLTAGASNLQQQAFAGGSEMAQAGYTPGQFTNTFTSDVAQQYMNPYLQASLDPQLKELQRQSDIARIGDAGRLTKAGAYGGSRQAIMESEGRRNLLDKQQDVLGTGYKTAYDLAQQQYAKDRGDEEASRQFGANFGMKSVDMLSGLGAIERGITSEGIAADKAQFEEQRDFAYGMPKYQLGLLSGLPIGANTTSVDPDALSRLNTTISGLGASYKTLDDALRKLGVTGGAGATG